MSTLAKFLPKPREYSQKQLEELAVGGENWPSREEANELGNEFQAYLSHYEQDEERRTIERLWRYCLSQQKGAPVSALAIANAHIGQSPFVSNAIRNVLARALSATGEEAAELRRHPLYQTLHALAADKKSSYGSLDMSLLPGPKGLLFDQALLDGLKKVAQHPDETVAREFFNRFGYSFRALLAQGTLGYFKKTGFDRQEDPVMSNEAERVFRILWDALCDRVAGDLMNVDYTFLLDDILYMIYPQDVAVDLEAVRLGRHLVALDFERTRRIVDKIGRQGFFNWIAKYRYEPVRRKLSGLAANRLDVGDVIKVLKKKTVDRTILDSIVAANLTPEATAALWEWSLYVLSGNKLQESNINGARWFTYSQLERGELLPTHIAERLRLLLQVATNSSAVWMATIGVPADISSLDDARRSAYEAILALGHSVKKGDIGFQLVIAEGRYGTELAKAITGCLKVKAGCGMDPDLGRDLDRLRPAQWQSLSKGDWSHILSEKCDTAVRQWLMGKMTATLGVEGPGLRA